MKSAKVPSFSSPEFHQSTLSAFASNLTATWGEFYNQAHLDNDASLISYGGWCGIWEDSGLPASQTEGFDISFGQFVLPGISTVVNFGAVDGWKDLLWSSNLLCHQTVQSKRPPNSPFTRFAFSAQINKCLYDGCVTALQKDSLNFGGFSQRDAQIRRHIYPACKSIIYA